jgi:tetratricopeptide (TPR) repeat protein
LAICIGGARKTAVQPGFGSSIHADRNNGKVSEMTISQVLDRAINWPSPQGLVAAVALGAVLLVIAGVLLLRGKRAWWVHILGALGAIAVLGALIDVQVQTIREQQGEVTSIRPRFAERTRWLASSAMIGIPALCAAIALGSWTAEQRRLRRQIPHLIKAGRMHFVQKEFDQALMAFNRAVALAPYRAEALCGRGQVHQAMGKVELALADFDQAIRRDPRLAVAYIHRGKIHTERGELEPALADFNHVLPMRPTDPELYLSRGISLMKKGQLSEAVADFHRVLKLTNHSDFAEPAKRYLNELEGRAESPLPGTGFNGPPASPATPQPRPGDYAR